MKLLNEHPLLIGRLVESFNARQAKLAGRRARFLSIAFVIAICLAILMAAWAVGARFYLSINP